MKQHNEPKKIQLNNVKYGINLNFMYGCHDYKNKLL